MARKDASCDHVASTSIYYSPACAGVLANELGKPLCLQECALSVGDLELVRGQLHLLVCDLRIPVLGRKMQQVLNGRIAVGDSNFNVR